MYAVISSLRYHDKIKEVIDSLAEQLIYEQSGNSINIVEEMSIISRFNIECLILDVSSINNVDMLTNTMKDYRIKKDTTRVIIIAPDFMPGNKLMQSLVTMGIYDLINEDDEDKLFLSLLKVIKEPTPYSEAVKWEQNFAINNSIVYSDQQNQINQEVNDNNNICVHEEPKQSLIEDNHKLDDDRSIQEKIIGNVVIAVVGTMNRVGTTHTAISIANFLATKKFKVAIVELDKSECFKYIKNSYFNVNNVNDYEFILSNIHFYCYYDDLKVSNIIAENYDYIILDMGKYDKDNVYYDEFKRANSRIVVAGIKDWEINYLEEILCDISYLNKTYYYFTFSDDKIFNLVKKNINQGSCYKASYMPNPFELSKQSEDMFSEMIKEFLPRYESNKKPIFNVSTSLKRLFVQGG